jgi:hypothetical protein
LSDSALVRITTSWRRGSGIGRSTSLRWSRPNWPSITIAFIAVLLSRGASIEPHIAAKVKARESRGRGSLRDRKCDGGGASLAISADFLSRRTESEAPTYPKG